MTKKFERMMPSVIEEDGEVRDSDVHLEGGAHIRVVGSHNNLRSLRLHVPELWFTPRALEQLIAELLFLKEEWDNHPIVLEREQKEDMEEDNPFDEDEEELELDEDGELEEMPMPQPIRWYRLRP